MTVFADTYYYLALLNASDAAHTRAVECSRGAGAGVVTSAWVLVELADALCRPHARVWFSVLLSTVRGDAGTEIVPPDARLLDSAIDLYRAPRQVLVPHGLHVLRPHDRARDHRRTDG